MVAFGHKKFSPLITFLKNCLVRFKEELILAISPSNKPAKVVGSLSEWTKDVVMISSKTKIIIFLERSMKPLISSHSGCSVSHQKCHVEIDHYADRWLLISVLRVCFAVADWLAGVWLTLYLSVLKKHVWLAMETKVWLGFVPKMSHHYRFVCLDSIHCDTNFTTVWSSMLGPSSFRFAHHFTLGWSNYSIFSAIESWWQKCTYHRYKKLLGPVHLKTDKCHV